jgi:hypothetical protein
VKEYETWPRLVKHENGYYYALYQDEGGQKHRTSLKTQNFNEASSKYNRLLENVSKGILGFDPNPKTYPCSKGIEKYLQEGTADLAKSTLQRYKEAINNHLKPYFGKMSLRAVKPSTVLAYVRHRQTKKVAPFTIHKELNVLSAIFNSTCKKRRLLTIPFSPSRNRRSACYARTTPPPNQSSSGSWITCLKVQSASS